MYFLKCSKCGHLNEVKSEYLIFCSKCDKKLDNSYTDWQKRNSEKSFDDYKQLICITETEVQKSTVKTKTYNFKSLKYGLAFAIAFAIFYAIGHFGGEKIISFFSKPAYDKAMTKFASEISKNCPMMIDNVTRLDNAIALPDNAIQYSYTIINVVKDSINIDEAKKVLGPRISNFVRTNPEMQFIRNHKTTVNYYYSDRKGVYLFTISVKPSQYE